jgi:hypothetical protein
VFIVSIFSLVGTVVDQVFRFDFSKYSPSPAPSPPPTPSILTGFPLLAPIGLALLLGGIALLLSARRSKDTILRHHLRWFGIFVIFLYFTNEAENEALSHAFLLSNPLLLQIVTFALFIISAYLLYRSARSLTPVNPYPVATTVEEEQGVEKG